MKSIFFLPFFLINTFAQDGNYELELVQALFRHGDRIPDKWEVYPTDPHNPKDYDPPGYGQLTKIGMQRMYKVGQLLRERYYDFIGDYKHDKVYAYSSHFDRAKESLQLVLAGLFEPSPNNTWNEELKWIPIATHYEPNKTDFLRGTTSGACGNETKIHETMDNWPKVQETQAKEKDFLDYVGNKTGIGNFTYRDAVLVISNLRAIKSLGLELPSWCSEEDFAKLYDLGVLYRNATLATPELQKQYAGHMVKKFLDNMKVHKKDDKIKIYLYSGHDKNLAPFTRVHNFTGIPLLPEYGNTVIIEKLRDKNDEPYVRMLLWTGVSEKLIQLKLENCEYECPLSEYEKIMSPVFPGPEFENCLSVNCTATSQ